MKRAVMIWIEGDLVDDGQLFFPYVVDALNRHIKGLGSGEVNAKIGRQLISKEKPRIRLMWRAFSESGGKVELEEIKEMRHISEGQHIDVTKKPILRTGEEGQGIPNAVVEEVEETNEVK